MPSFCRKYTFLIMLLLFPAVVHPQIPQQAVPPAEAAGLYEQAPELYRQGELDAAVARLRIVTGSWPGLEEPWTLLSVALLQTEDFDGAEEAVRNGLENIPASVRVTAGSDDGIVIDRLALGSTVLKAVLKGPETNDSVSFYPVPLRRHQLPTEYEMILILF
jgi:hypothetical protein